MLPTMTLQLTDLANFEPPGTAQQLLPAEAAPVANFATLLEIDLESARNPGFEGGEAFPQDGNPLPVEVGTGTEASVPALPFEPQPDTVIRALVAAPAASADSMVPAAGETRQPVLRPLPDVGVTLAAGSARPRGPVPSVATPVTPAPAAAAERVAVDAVPATLSGSPPRAEPRPGPAQAVQQLGVRPDPGPAPRTSADAAADKRVIAALAGVDDLPRPAPKDSPAPAPVADVRREIGSPSRPVLPVPASQGPAPSLQPGPGVEAPETPSPQLSTPAPAPAAAPAARFVATPVPDPALTQASIELPVTDTEWGEQLGQRVQLMASNRLQTAEIRLSPAELGPLRIQVSVDDGAASVTFHAQHAVTREAIEQALPRLREMLAENGLTLAQSSVGEQGNAGGRESAGERQLSASAGGDAPADPALADTAQPRERRPEGLVDTFA